MTATTVTIRPATPTEAMGVAITIAVAFDPIHLSRWLIPDPVHRSRILPYYFRILVDHALDVGRVDVTADLGAAAVWLPWPTPPIPDYANRMTSACGVWSHRFHTLDAAQEAAHPTGRGEHDYLAFLAVLPEHQGTGVGTALLTHHHITRPRRAAYLEASNPRSAALYRRHGYGDCGAPFALPYRGEQLQPMWRPAAG